MPRVYVDLDDITDKKLSVYVAEDRQRTKKQIINDAVLNFLKQKHKK